MHSGTATPETATEAGARVGIEGFPLSLQQERLWALRGGGDTPYRVHAALLLEGALDEDRLRGALGAVASAHEVLRTTFRRLPGMEAPLQVIEDEPRVEWESVDLSHQEPPLQQLFLQRLFDEQAALPFALDDAPPMRLHLVQLADDRHVLVVGLPAVAFDAFSIDPFMARLAEAYAGVEDEDAPEPVQYVDFSEWQGEMLDSPDEEGGREYWWSQRLASTPVAPLPLERRTPLATGAFAPQSVAWEMEGDEARRLEALAASLGASVESVLFSAWAALVGRLSGAPSVVLGRLSHGRAVEDLRETLGPLFKVLPVRAEPGSARTFAELVRETHPQIEGADAHHEFFSPRILGDGRTGAVALPPYLFAFREWPQARDADGVRISLHLEHSCHEPFRLELSAMVRDGEVRCALRFDPARYIATDAELIAGQLRSLIAGVLEDADAPLASASLVDEAQLKLLAAWNDTRREHPAETFVSRFEARVAADPSADAVVFRDTVLTFGELNARANRLARRLVAMGVRPDDRVAFCLNRSAELIVTVVAIMKAGAAYVPLDPWQPAERLRLIVEEVSPRLVIADRDFFENVRIDGCTLVERTELEASAASESAENLGVAVEPENLAYLIYTSGSTGRPKGVMIQHGSLANLSRALGERLGGDLPAGSRVSINAPLAFDSSVKQLVRLLDGHAVCVLPEEVRRDGAELLGYLREKRIEALDCTPAQLKLMAAAGLDRAEEALRLVLVGGEAVDDRLWREAAKLGRTAFHNVYGPTECTVDATACRFTADADRPLIGRALPNVRVYVLDADLRPAPVGAAGQLCIGGRGVARGYFRRPGMTAERFVPDPFADEPGARMYLTGDQARFMGDGSVDFLGRIDRQVKLRGYRIELGEIEEVLLSHPGVRQSAVVLHEDANEQARLVAYAAPERKWAPTVDGHPRHSLPNGLSIVHHRERETERLYARCFDRRSWLGDGLPESAVVVDAGANTGLFALAVREAYPDARVIAFEPVPPLFDLLRINAEIHGEGRIEAVPAGLGRAEGSGRLAFHAAWSLLSGPADSAAGAEELAALLGGGGAGETVEYEAPTRTLSAVIRERALERIDLLRVAVHDAEADVLAGIESADWAKIDRVAVEICDREGEPARRRIDAVRAILEPLGYRTESTPEPRLPGADLFTVHAVRDGVGAAIAPARREQPEPREDALVTGAVLRRFAKERLPEYMVPAQFVVLETLPLTPNGKVDRRALPKPSEERQLESSYEQPGTPVEEKLAEIWSRLLGVERIGVRDNFFELGGDSILSIQVVARANEAGIRLTPRQMFEYQTIAELAAVAGETRTIVADQGVVSGEVPLTPVQARLLGRRLGRPEHFNQAVMLAGDGEIDIDRLHAVFQALVEHHDVLRHRFVREGDAWRQEGLETADGSLHYAWADLSHLSDADRPAEIARLAEEAQRGLDLAAGPLVRVRGMRWGAGWRLLIVIHHLVVDGVSWRILLEDLQKGYRQLSAGEPIDFGAKTTSFRYWSERLLRHAREDEGLRSELGYWLDDARREVVALPRDLDGENVEATAEWAETSLDEERTRQLLQEAPKAYNTGVQDLLLAALSTAVVRWSGEGSGSVLVELEGHGREEMFSEVELARTVGWFTALYPVALPARRDEAPGESLTRTKEILRQVPGRGVGFGVLRYLGDDETRAALAALPEPEIGFNYLGRLDEVLEEGGTFRPAREGTGPSRAAEGERAHLVDVSASVSGGRLELRFIYSRAVHHAESIERLADLTRERVVELVEHCLDPRAGAYTPSDFPLAGLDDEQLGSILAGFEFEEESR